MPKSLFRGKENRMNGLFMELHLLVALGLLGIYIS